MSSPKTAKVASVTDQNILKLSTWLIKICKFLASQEIVPLFRLNSKVVKDLKKNIEPYRETPQTVLRILLCL